MVTVISQGEGYTHRVETPNHVITADEPLDLGGADQGPNPYELLLAALGSCTAITMRMYANRKKWPLEGVRIQLDVKRVHAKDCEDCEQKTGVVDVIEKQIECRGPLTEEQRTRLMEIADRCPVHRTLLSGAKVRTQWMTADE